MEIVVAVLPREATIVPFSVQLIGDGKIDIQAGNGVFVAGDMPANEEEAENLLNASDLGFARVLTSQRTLTGYAYSGTIITLIPKLDEGCQVNQILVDGKNVPDELPSNGFSYTLRDNSANEITITVGGLDHENETPIVY